MNQPTRRQNSSCDPCRRSKRRCALPDGTLGVPGKTICINCANLGHRCTFKFVQRTRQHKESRASRSSISLLELEDAVTSQSDNRDEEQMQLAVSESHNDTLTDFGDLSVWSNVSPGAFTDFDVFLNDLDGDWSNFAGLSDVGSSEDYHIPQDFPANCPEELTFSPPQNGPRLGLSRSSPLHLLNSRFEVDMMNKGLESIYDAVMTGAAARYLGYWCNSFADMHRYEFDGGDLNFQDPNRPCALDQSKALPLYQYTSATSTDNVIVDVPEYQYPTPADSSLDVASPNKDVAQQVTKVTLIGICKFLDNFGRLYGNELDKRARKEDEHTFAAVVQAFALQWLPNDSRKARSSKSDELPTLGSAHEKGRACHNTNLFEAAWYNAYSRLLGTRMNPSFVHCYSVFLFDMTAKPWNLSKRWPSVENTVAILDTALHQLKDLYGLVKSYCELLAATSVYRSLLHSSVNIIRWFGCVRDTIASFQHQRSCVFRELLLRSSGAKDTSTPLLAQQEVHSNISVNIPEMCQKAVRHLFGLFGCVNELKQILRSSLALPDELGLGNLFSQTIALVTDFNYNFSHQVGHHIQNLSQLDEKSQISVAFLQLFWHTGILCLVEQMQLAQELYPSSCIFDVASQAQSYQASAISSLVDVCAQITAYEEIKPSHHPDTRLPLICHHINVELVVFALGKAVKHCITNQIFYSDLSNDVTEEVGSRNDSLKPLLSCLLTLESTVAGLQTARTAYQDLLRHYSDILMDSWIS